MALSTRFRVLDPTLEAQVDAAFGAPRLADLNGKVIGLWSNKKLNADKLLDMVEGLLWERYQLKGFVRGNYNSGRVMNPAEMKGVEDCDAVILTHGD